MQKAGARETAQTSAHGRLVAGSRGGETRLAELVQSAALLRGLEREGREEEREEEEASEEEEDDDDELMASASVLEEEEEMEEEEEEREYHKVLYEAQALANFSAEETKDLSFKEGERLRVVSVSTGDGWLEAENALGERGFVPGNFMKRLPSPPMGASRTTRGAQSLSPRKGRDLWTKLRTTLHQTSLADVLAAFGAIPSGFRDSTLAALLSDSCHMTSWWAHPHLSPTGMALRGLSWDHTKDQLRAQGSQVMRSFSVIAATMIPLPGKGITVLSRQVRIAIFSRNNVASNVHTIRATCSPRDKRRWVFAAKSQTVFNSLYHRVCVLRLDQGNTDTVSNALTFTVSPTELLFELGLTVRRERSGEVGEFSCGWCSLPLYEHVGSPTPNRTYRLLVHGGAPFEKGVDLDPAQNIGARGRLPGILRTNRTPKLYVQLHPLTKTEKHTMVYLPPTILTCSLYCSSLACFRHLLGSAFLKGRAGLPILYYVSKPSLNAYLQSLDHPDLMDCILSSWNHRMKKVQRRDKRQLSCMAGQLECVLLELILPLLHSPSLPPPLAGDEDREKARYQFIEKFSQKNHLSPVLAADCEQTPLSIAENVFKPMASCT